MIPKRIKLCGFLCYKEEQEVAFDGSTLWMLSGLNGSGKSSVFDAVTYALFGYHRGGSQGAVDLINKAENGFTVEFDFQLEGQLYRIRRTLKRRATSTAATQQVLQFQPATGDFEAVADTHRKAEFDKWVAEHIGLNYETFTSSVLLLQGRAEKLLDSTAKGRAEVLASIVDLERYQKLHEKADGQRKALKGQVEVLQNQLNAIAEVTPLELAAAISRIDDAEGVAEESNKHVERLLKLEYQARQWGDVQRKLAAALERRASATKLIHEADRVEQQVNRLKELRDVLPHVDQIVQRRADLSRSEEATKHLTDRLRELQGRQFAVEHTLDEAQRRKTQVQKGIAAAEEKAARIAERLPQASAALERVKLVEQRRAEFAELEAGFAKFPADLRAKLTRAELMTNELVALERALSPLGRFATARGELRNAHETLTAAEQDEAAKRLQGEEMRKQQDALKPPLDASRATLKQVEEKLASEKALLKQANELTAEFDRLDGAKTCRACGQELTPAHFRDEKSRREKAVADAQRRAKKAQQDLKDAQNSEKDVSEQFASIDQQLQSAREEYKLARAQLQQAQKDVMRLTAECQRAVAELAEPFRKRVADGSPPDWGNTIFPTAGELDQARNQVLALPAAQRELTHLRDLMSKHNALASRIELARQDLADQQSTLNGDAAELRREFTRLDSEAKALGEQLKADRSEERSAQAEIDRLRNELTDVGQALTDGRGKIQVEETTRKHCQTAIATSRKVLSAEWQEQADRAALAELSRWRGERDELERNGVEARAKELRDARIEVESLRQTIAELEKEAGQFPVESRREVAETQQDLVAARAAHAAALDQLNAARNERANLEMRARQRQQVREKLGEAERAGKRFKTLAELLGRDRLQRYLVRTAERQIIDCANSVLDRLSGGTLMLRIVSTDDGTSADQALELEAYNRATGEAPIGVAFLSGSQRFRVAVSLALGIGQYASRLHRPIESVIIDEGFGCLDRNGRQVMIQELQNLRGHLQCILLVSHQEEFAEAFADGYRFELADGATKVTRVQR
jgi:exonuclease SbcC